MLKSRDFGEIRKMTQKVVKNGFLTPFLRKTYIFLPPLIAGNEGGGSKNRCFWGPKNGPKTPKKWSVFLLRFSVFSGFGGILCLESAENGISGFWPDPKIGPFSSFSRFSSFSVFFRFFRVFLCFFVFFRVFSCFFGFFVFLRFFSSFPSLPPSPSPSFPFPPSLPFSLPAQKRDSKFEVTDLILEQK